MKTNSEEPAENKKILRVVLNRKVLKTLIGLVVITIFTTLVTHHWNKMTSGPDEYLLYVVGGKADVYGEKDFAYHMWRGIKDEWNNVTVGNKTVNVKYLQDMWEPERAFEISQRLARRKDVLMVIGHFASSTSREALKNYLVAEPPIPIILTTETTPYLIPESLVERSSDLPLFRLWPTDKEQAESVADFATATGDEVFWVVEDRWKNTVYSHYLADEIVTQLQEKKGNNVILWSHNESIPSTKTLRDLGIQSVIFTGVASNALIFVNQVRKIWSEGSCQEPECEKPNIFLVDASIDVEILKNHIDEMEGVYVTHPGLVPCKKIANTVAPENLMQTGNLARDAAEIAKKLINDAKDDIQPPLFRSILGIQSVKDVRRAIAGVMKKSKNNNKIYVGVNEEHGKSISYVFDKDGKNKKAEFRLWKIQGGQFRELEKKNDSIIMKPCS